MLLTASILSGEAVKKSEVYFEFFYGYSFISPSDLNLNSVYNNRYFNYYYNLYRDNYNNVNCRATSSGINGEFKELKKNSIFGGRIKYYFPSNTKRSKWAVSLSFKYLYGISDSSAELEYKFDDFFSGEYTNTRKIDPFRLYIKGYVPQMGIHYTILDNNSISLETFFSAGKIFASCGSFEQYYFKRTENTDYIYELEIILDNDGKGRGLSLETGLKLEANLFKSIGIFIEGGYSYQKISKVHGNAMYKRSAKDNNTDGYIEQYNWSEDWVIQEYSLGKRHEVYHGPDQDSLTDFTLDLSGFYIRIGLSIKIF